VWCSDDPRTHQALSFCFRCFCEATDAYKQEFWRKAPARLKDELTRCTRAATAWGLLIRMKKLSTPQLLEALVEQRHRPAAGRGPGPPRHVSREDIETALRTQG